MVAQDVRYTDVIELFPLFFSLNGLYRRKFCNIFILFAHIAQDDWNIRKSKLTCGLMWLLCQINMKHYVFWIKETLFGVGEMIKSHCELSAEKNLELSQNIKLSPVLYITHPDKQPRFKDFTLPKFLTIQINLSTTQASLIKSISMSGCNPS